MSSRCDLHLLFYRIRAYAFAQDIFRKYPSRYEGIIPTLCANLNELDEPEAKASLVWILGEYAEKIDNADELLSTFLATFLDDPFQVRSLITDRMLRADTRTGPTANAHGHSQAVLEEAGRIARARSADSDDSDKAVRQPGYPRSSVYLLASSVLRLGRSEGALISSLVGHQ